MSNLILDVEHMRRVYHSECKTLTSFQGLPENFAPLLVENIKKGGFTHILAGNSAFGKNVMPRIAALLDTQQISDITGIESEDSKSHPVPNCRNS